MVRKWPPAINMRPNLHPPPSAQYVGRSFRATPRQLGFITLACALVQAMCAPVGGLMGHYMNRRVAVAVCACTCVCWSVCVCVWGGGGKGGEWGGGGGGGDGDAGATGYVGAAGCCFCFVSKDVA